MSDLAALVDLIRTGGLPLIVAILVYGGYKGWYVWGWTYRESLKAMQVQLDMAIKDRDGWREATKTGVSDAMVAIDKAVEIVRHNSNTSPRTP